MYVGTAHLLILGASLRASVFYVLYQFLGKNSWQKNVNQEIKIFITSCAIHTCQSAISLVCAWCWLSAYSPEDWGFNNNWLAPAAWLPPGLIHISSNLPFFSIICTWCEFLCCVGKKFCQVWRELICLIYDKNAFLKLIFSAKVFLLSCHLFDPRFSPISLVAQQRHSKCFSHKSSRP